MTEDVTCLVCGESFKSIRSLHGHLRKHDISVEEYYIKNYPRFDLLTKESIPYKNREQYLSQNFVNRENMRKWLDQFEAENLIAQTFLEERFLSKIKEKKIKHAPPALYLKLSDLPPKSYYDLHFDSYNQFCKEIGLKNIYKDHLPKLFWEEQYYRNMQIFIDTREQRPLSFDLTTFRQKLDFGDYTASGIHYSKTYIERKSAADFVSTMSQNIKRFTREIERCVEFQSHLFVVVESTPETITNNLKFNPNMDYVWHNTRELMIKYPHNLQFLFVVNRAGAKNIIPKLLFHGQKLWTVDVNSYLEERISKCRGKKVAKNTA